MFLSLPDPRVAQSDRSHSASSLPEIIADTRSRFGWRSALDWPVAEERGVIAEEGPEGAAWRFTSGHAVFRDLPPLDLSQPWTLQFWVRPDQGDWGPVLAGFPFRQWSWPSPVLVSCAPWTVRLARQRVEFICWTWKVWGQRELPVGEWSHVALTWNGSTLQIYGNGLPEMLCHVPELDPATGHLVPPLRITPESSAPPGAFVGAILNSVTLAQRADAPDWGEQFFGALCAVELRAEELPADDIARHVFARKTSAARLARRPSVLDVPAIGRSRRPDRRNESPEAFAQRMQWFREVRYGIFLHWSSCCVEEMEIGWGRGETPDSEAPTPTSHDQAGTIQTQIAASTARHVVADRYDELYRSFHPSRFDPKAWAETMKASGMKYGVLTAKHHDGFCLWPSESSGYSVASTPYQSDLVGPFLAALRESGLRAGLYYSQRDFWWRSSRPQLSDEAQASIVAYVRAQIRELCETYQPDCLWFDGGVGGEREIFQEDIAPRLAEGLVNDRNSPGGADYRTGDYITPEGQMPSRPLVNPDGSDTPWELCHVMEVTGEGGWSYHRGATLRSYRDLLHELVECVAKGGNLLRNVGPRADGTLPAGLVFRLEQIGRWLEANGTSIFGTHRTHLGRQPFGWTTASHDTLYLHVIDWPGNVLLVKNFYDEAPDARLLVGGQPLRCVQEESLLTIELPDTPPDAIDTVIAVRCRRVARGLPRNRPSQHTGLSQSSS